MGEQGQFAVPSDAGRALAELRKVAGKSQADVSRALSIDASRVSRIETGDVSLSATDIQTFVDALGTKRAHEYLAYLKRPFRVLTRPEFSHPNRETLCNADEYLQRLEDFVTAPDLPGPLVRQADMFRDTLLRSAAYIANLDHSIAYIGEIGIGKTTVVCMQTGLVLDGVDKAGLEKIVLEFGRGGITICEVRIKYNDRFGLIVEPCPDAEVYRLVDDLCAGLWNQGDPSGDDERQERGVPRDINRALRNMAGLNRQRRKGPDGKPIRFDLAKELLTRFSRLDDFRAEFSSRLKLWQRKRREAWHESAARESGPIWLRRMFAEINNGRNSEFPLPQRVTVHVPSEMLRKHGYVLEMIDTKGVDRTAIMPDLQSCIDDPRTLTLLCSRFTQAPDVSLQALIEHLASTGAERALRERVGMLVLAHDTEALGMKDDSGVLAESEAEGYELRREQVEAELARVGAPDLPVHFFNAKTETPEAITRSLVAQITAMRDAHVRKISEVTAAIEQLIKNRDEQHALAAQQEVNKKLRVFADQHQKLGPRKRPAYASLVSAFRSLHPSTVWATTRRSGSWPGLDVFFYLGAGTESDARLRSDGRLDGLKEVIRNMLGDDDLSPAHRFLKQLLSAVDNWRDSFLEAVRRSGEFTYRPQLESSDELWSACEDLYGRGLPYRVEVANKVQEWFENDERDHLHTQLESRVDEAWQLQVLEPLNNISEAFAVESNSNDHDAAA